MTQSLAQQCKLARELGGTYKALALERPEPLGKLDQARKMARVVQSARRLLTHDAARQVFERVKGQ